MLKFSRTGCAAAIALLIGATAVVVPGVAQTFPSGNVKLIVPVPAGGVTDTMARKHDGPLPLVDELAAGLGADDSHSAGDENPHCRLIRSWHRPR